MPWRSNGSDGLTKTSAMVYKDYNRPQLDNYSVQFAYLFQAYVFTKFIFRSVCLYRLLAHLR